MNDCYVYGWFNCDWKAYFYVGRGRGSRWKDAKKRSKAFDAVLKNWSCEPVLLLEGLSEAESVLAETQVKEKFLFELGYPLLDAEPKSLKAEAQRLGIEKARAAGKYKGRKPIAINPYEFEKLLSEVRSGERTNKYVMDKLGLTRTTYYKLVGEYDKRDGRFAGM